jgi:hypothetical protein
MPLSGWSKRKSKSEVFDDRNLLEFVLIKKKYSLHLQSVRNSGLFFVGKRRYDAGVAQLARAADL